MTKSPVVSFFALANQSLLCFFDFHSFEQLNPETLDTDGVLDGIRKDRGYSYHDVIECSPEKLPNYEEKVN
jgi:hypothetical protein